MVQVVLRRFYVLIPLVAASALLAVLYGQSVKPTYQYSASLLLVSPTPPAATTTKADVIPAVPYANPWFQVSKSLNPVATLIVGGMSARGVDTGVPAGSGVGVSFSGGNNTSIPIVTVTTSSTDRQAAQAAVSPAVQALNANLRAWQKATGATDNALVTTLAAPGGVSSTALYPGKTRGEAAIIAVGFVLSLVLTFVVEALAVRRRRRLVVDRARDKDRLALRSAPDERAEPVTAEF